MDEIVRLSSLEVKQQKALSVYIKLRNNIEYFLRDQSAVNTQPPTTDQFKEYIKFLRQEYSLDDPTKLEDNAEYEKALGYVLKIYDELFNINLKLNTAVVIERQNGHIFNMITAFFGIMVINVDYPNLNQNIFFLSFLIAVILPYFYTTQYFRLEDFLMNWKNAFSKIKGINELNSELSSYSNFNNEITDTEILVNLLSQVIANPNVSLRDTRIPDIILEKLASFNLPYQDGMLLTTIMKIVISNAEGLDSEFTEIQKAQAHIYWIHAVVVILICTAVSISSTYIVDHFSSGAIDNDTLKLLLTLISIAYSLALFSKNNNNN